MVGDLGAALLTPAIVLSVLVGSFHTCLYLVLRGRAGLHLLLTLPAAVLGAYAGQALAARLGDVLPLGDYGLAWASIVSWIGILVVAVASHGQTPAEAPDEAVERSRRR